MKRPKNFFIAILVLWMFTLGISVGTLPNGVPVIGTKDSYYWDEFVEGSRSLYALAFMEVPNYQVGIPFLFTLHGGIFPASVDIAINANEKYLDDTVILNKATLTYQDGQTYPLIHKKYPRAGVFHKEERDGIKYCRAKICVPNCIRKKQDFKIRISGFIKTEDEQIEINEDLSVLYSENTFFYIGWMEFLFFE